MPGLNLLYGKCPQSLQNKNTEYIKTLWADSLSHFTSLLLWQKARIQRILHHGWREIPPRRWVTVVVWHHKYPTQICISRTRQYSCLAASLLKFCTTKPGRVACAADVSGVVTQTCVEAVTCRRHCGVNKRKQLSLAQKSWALPSVLCHASS